MLVDIIKLVIKCAGIFLFVFTPILITTFSIQKEISTVEKEKKDALRLFSPVYLTICEAYFNGRKFTEYDYTEAIKNMDKIDEMYNIYDPHPRWYTIFYKKNPYLAGALVTFHMRDSYEIAKEIYEAIERDN